MGIPHKIASRGVMVIPMDFLPHETEMSKHHMYWGIGQLILKTARFVQKHPQLFGTYITNFSCGPDSFVIGYFREIMGRKPSLTLELDSHTADAGLETRIEAFLDIISSYRRLTKQQITAQCRRRLRHQGHACNGIPMVSTSDGKTIPMTDPRVSMLFPSMGNLASESITAIFKGSGYHAKAHPPSDEAVLKIGRANTSCKECLPLILTTGTLPKLHPKRKKRRGDSGLFHADWIRPMPVRSVCHLHGGFDSTVRNSQCGRHVPIFGQCLHGNRKRFSKKEDGGRSLFQMPWKTSVPCFWPMPKTRRGP